MNHHDERTHDAHTPAAAGQAAKDPVCGMNVDPKSAVRHEHGRKTYYFCSAHCEQKFSAGPQKYTTN